MSRKSLRLLLATGQFVLLIGLWHLGTEQKKIFCETKPIFCDATDMDVAPAWDAILVINFPLIIALAPLGFLARTHNFPDSLVFSILAFVTPFFWFRVASVVDRCIGLHPSADSRRRRTKWGLWIWFLAFVVAAALAWLSFVGNHLLSRWLELGAAVWSALAAAGCLAKIVRVRASSQLSSTGSG